MNYLKLIITATICLLPATHADKLPSHSFQSFTNGHVQTHSILTPNTDFGHNNFLEEKATVPKTNFLCEGKRGYFADIEADCKVFHICGPSNTQYDFFCSPGTLFNQKYAICDWSYNVNCQMSPEFFFLNNLADDAQYRSDDQLTKENVDPPTEWLEPPSPKTPESGNPPNTINSAPHADHQRDDRSSKAIRFEPSFQELRDKEEERDYTTVSQRDYTTVSQRDYTTVSQRDYTTGNQRDYTTVSQRDYTTGSQRDYVIGSQRDYATASQRDYTTGNQRDYTTVSQRDYITGGQRDYTIGGHLSEGGVTLTLVSPVPATSPTLTEKEVETVDGVSLRPSFRRRQYNNDTNNDISAAKATAHVQQSSGFRPVIPEDTKTYKLTPAVLISSVEESKDPETGVRYRKWRREGSKNSLEKTSEGGSTPLLTLKPEKPKWTRKDATKSPDDWIPFPANSLSKTDNKPQAKQSAGKFFPLLRLRQRKRIQKPKLFSTNQKNFSIRKAVSVNAVRSEKGDWSMKLEGNEFEPDLGIPKDSKIVLPLQPTVPIPQVTEETEIEYTEDLDAPLPPSGPGTIPDSEEINDVKVLQYLTGPEVDQVELTNLPAFKSTPNIGRTPRVYKIKNKGFRPLTIKQKVKNGEGEDIIELIKKELNLTHSPFSIRLIQIDDPYADRYNAQLYENLTVIENDPLVVETGDISSNAEDALDMFGQDSRNTYIIVHKFNETISQNLTKTNGNIPVQAGDMSSNAKDGLDMFGQDSSNTFIIVHKFNETISQNLTKTNGSTPVQSNVSGENFTEINGSTQVQYNASISTSTPTPNNSSTLANITSTNTTTKSAATQVTSILNTTTTDGTTTTKPTTFTPTITAITRFSPRFYSRSKPDSRLRLTRKKIYNSH